ncbi:MAG: hypothetical protein R3D84_14470 [Paracoccaceae bacterium]
MDHLEGAGLARGDRVDFDRRVRLEFRGAQISSDGGLLVMRELDDVLGLSNQRRRRCGQPEAYRLTDCSGNRCSDDWPDTRM